MSDAAELRASGDPTPNPVVLEWVEKARGDLSVARREHSAMPDGNLDAVCFHSQQAVEKLMKAALIARGRTPPHTHDLNVLSDLLSEALPDWHWKPEELRELSVGAVRVRYPGFTTTKESASRALSMAGEVWQALSSHLV